MMNGGSQYDRSAPNVIASRRSAVTNSATQEQSLEQLNKRKTCKQRFGLEL